MSKLNKKKKSGSKKPVGVPHFLLKTYEIVEVKPNLLEEVTFNRVFSKIEPKV